MRRISSKIVIFLVVVGYAIYLLLSFQSASNSSSKYELRISPTKDPVIDEQKSSDISSKIVLSFVVCDSRYNESLNVIKSSLLFTRLPIHYVIFTDDNLKPKFNQTLTKWSSLNNQLSYELHEINFPEEHREDWLNLFRKCAAQRLFIPKLIPHIDAMIYIDTDTLFMGPIEELWQHFSQFNSSQISAMTLEDDNPNVSWYPRFAKHPFYGKYGLNSGVMLMNLTRMRNFGWVDYVTPIMLKWKLYIPWGDQDIINVIFHYHPGAVMVLPCRYNYRSDQCMYGDACPSATSKGVFLLHGSRKAFHSYKQPALQAIFRAIEEYEVGSDPSKTLLINMEKYIAESPPSNCGNLKDTLLRVPTQTFQTLYSIPVR